MIMRIGTALARAGTLVRHVGGWRPSTRRMLDAESLLAAVLNAALDAVVISRADGRIMEFNPAARCMFGRAIGHGPAPFISDLIVVPPGKDASSSPGGNVLGIFGERVELDARRADGSLFPAEIAIHRVRSGRQTIFAAYVRDLTAQRRAEATLEEGRQRLGHAEKLSAMGSLLATVAHELNNPLAILMAQSTVLQDKAPTADVAQRAERIHAAAHRAGRILKGFLGMARQRPPLRETLDLNAALDDALDLLGHGMRGTGIEVERAFDPALRPVEADRDLIGQVFVNVLVNAQQAVAEHPGARRIAVRSARRGDAAVIEIEDNGAGVDPDIADRIFDPYFTTKPAGTALGVGLSLCRSILAAHGGTIELRPRPDGGATVSISLPSSDPAVPAGGAKAGPSSELSVLVVDDEADVADSLAELIGLFGHRVHVETSAETALRIVDERGFDAVFADFHMPGLDGMALRRALAEVDPGLAARTVIVTGDTLARSVDDHHPTLEAGALVLEKPFTAAGVKALLDQVAKT